jgi:hypothetical protein
METITKLSWTILAVIHVMPALVLFVPDLTLQLYDVPSDGDMGILFTHRGGLFLGVFIAAFLAGFMPDMRRLASVVVAISVISFLFVYLRAGLPDNSLRKIAIIDVLALFPLAWVTWQSWFH